MSEFQVSRATRPLRGAVRVPADKSISHRAAMLAALAEGDTRIENFLDSATTRATLDCLRALGVEISAPDAPALTVHGRGLRELREPRETLFCAGSGTTMRLLAGICAGQDFFSLLDGTPALQRRPMARVIEPLRAMGATILGREQNSYAPFAIRGTSRLQGIECTMKVASAQVKSAILFAGLYADAPTTVREPAPSRDHTERMLKAFGAQIENPDSAIRIHPISNLQSPNSIFIPGDFSSAAFFIVAALLTPHSEICLTGVGLNPTRTGLLDALAAMGARVTIENGRAESGEPVADVIVRAADGLQGTRVAGTLVPRMIDEFPIFAVAATQARGDTDVRDAQELRVKESDRITTMAQELRKMGARIEERVDGFSIQGPTRLRGARVSAHGDHRLALALAVAGLLAEGETIIADWECIADSFPDFAETLAGLTR